MYYSGIAVAPWAMRVMAVFFGVLTVIVVFTEFPGSIHDPVQTVTGIRRRPLNEMLDAIEESVSETAAKEQRPRYALFGRIHDLIDWIEGLLPF